MKNIIDKTKTLIVGVQIWVCLLLGALISCTTVKENTSIVEEKPIIANSVDNTYNSSTTQDSVYHKEFTTIEIKSDTVFKTQYIELYKYKNKVDTFIKVDSVPVITTITKTVTVTKEVEKSLRWWQKLYQVLGCIFITILCFKGIRLLYKMK